MKTFAKNLIVTVLLVVAIYGGLVFIFGQKNVENTAKQGAVHFTAILYNLVDRTEGISYGTQYEGQGFFGDQTRMYIVKYDGGEPVGRSVNYFTLEGNWMEFL